MKTTIVVIAVALGLMYSVALALADVFRPLLAALGAQ